MKNKLWMMVVLGITITACQHRFGDKIERDGKKVYYLEPLTSKDAVNTMDFLEESSFNFGVPVIPVQISQQHDTIHFKMEIQIDGAEEEEGNLVYMRYLAQRMSERVFDNKPVTVHLCNSDLETKKIIPFQKVVGTAIE